MRFYDDELEVYLGTIDGQVIDAWTRVLASWNTTEIMRADVWWDATENLDLLLMIIGDDNVYEWNGAVAAVLSITGTTVTKKDTTTFAQNRFYTTRNKTLICVRTRTEYTYTGGETTTTLTGIADTTGLVAGDILIQKIVTQSNKPAADRTNDTIFVFENQLCLGSFDDNEIYISQNDDYDDFAYSTPRIAGEGGLLTLDAPSSGIKAAGKILILFSGRSSVFRAEYTEITVSTTLTETLRVKRLDAGVDQGAFSPDTITQISNAIVYLSNEPALRIIENPDNIGGINPKTLSNPIKPDFDAEDFTSAQLTWYKNAIHLSSPVNSRLYILEFVEDADGKVRRFWQPPQILPIRSFSIYNGLLYAGSNSVAETYNLFAEDTYSDINSSDEKIPIQAIAAFSYQSFGKRSNLKDFDEYAVEGEISPQTNDLKLTLNYDYGGFTQSVEKIIDGTDSDILAQTLLAASLGQQSLAQNPLGGNLDAPTDTSKFRVIFEIAKEAFHEIQPIFSTNAEDRFWSIISQGANVKLSRRIATQISK